MRTIIHISDLHFGKTESLVEKALIETINEHSCDLVVVTGDITQRATALQFILAHEFFASLACPILSVPGNHDIPLYSVWRRFIHPYKLYKKYISSNIEPQYEDEEMLVVGINTVRLFKAVQGRINNKQIAHIKDVFSSVSSNKIKILVSHHPFNLPLGLSKKPMVHARNFWKNLKGTEVDIVLSGHLHDTLDFYIGKTYQLETPGPILIQAGTSISTRRRKEENAFNIITISTDLIEIDRYKFVQARKAFKRINTEHFKRNLKPT